jgi:dsRNA-specific ribonuclease
VFEIEAPLSNGATASAKAASKRQAQQMAAAKLLEQVNEKP